MTHAKQADARQIFQQPPRKFLDMGHSEIPYRVVGEGPDVLFVHGWPLHGATYRKVIAELAPTHRCHVIDLPGAGESKFDRQTPIRMSAHVDVVKRAADQIGLERYAMVAQDSGGLIARFVAANDPRVTGLALANTEIPGHHPLLVSALASLSRLPGFDATMAGLMKSRRVRRSSIGFKGCFYDRSLVEGEFFDLFVRPLLESDHAMWGAMELARTLEHHLTDDLREAHRKLNMPVQLVWGDGDPFFPLAEARGMVTQFPDAELHVIERARLLVYEEHPEAFVRLALRALSGPPADARVEPRRPNRELS
ncbi:MAG: alpha/beta hydrolase [Myxococcota bacterium]